MKVEEQEALWAYIKRIVIAVRAAAKSFRFKALSKPATDVLAELKVSKAQAELTAINRDIGNV